MPPCVSGCSTASAASGKCSPPPSERRDALRSRLALTALEDRTVPTTVTISKIADLTEGDGATAVFRLTRDDTSGSLMVNVSASGTATGGGGTNDYSYIFSPVMFGMGQATADVTITPLDDSTSEPTETIILTITAGSGYTIGTQNSATANLFDNDAQYVSVAKVNDAGEAGTTGQFQLTRTGDLTNSLTVNVSAGGTATSGTDYTTLGSTVTFAAGSATATVNVVATADNIYDPDETVVLTVGTGTGYSVGAQNSDTVTIADDIDAVQTLIHQQTFQLTGANGNVDVTLTVTHNATGAAGLYTWSYVVSNPSINTSSWTTFAVPIDNADGLTDLGNLTSSIGWTGTIGTDKVSWAAGTALAPGSTATFSFTTAPREVGGATIVATGAGGAVSADLPTAPAPREVAVVPGVNISFQPGNNTFDLKLDLTVAEGTGLTSGTMPISGSTATTARDFVYSFLVANNWAVEKAGDNGLIIKGKVLSNGTIVAVKSLNWKRTNLASGGAVIQGTGQVTVTNN